MATFASLHAKSQSIVLSAYFGASSAAEENRLPEYTSAIKIQSAWRGYVVREDLRIKRRAATDVQRAYRGFRGRLKFDDALRAKFLRERQEYFCSAATLVQRIWRGHYVRKNVLDFYERKAYLTDVRLKNERLRAELAERAAIQAKLDEEENRRRTEEEFRQKTASLHYLVSTKSHAGVFSQRREKINGVLIEGLPLEEHIRHNALNSIKLDSKYFSSTMRQEMSTEHWSAPMGTMVGSNGGASTSGYVTLPPISPPQALGSKTKKFVSVKP